MKTIDEYLDEQINEQLCQAVLSGSKGEGPSKAKIRPVENQRTGDLPGF